MIVLQFDRRYHRWGLLLLRSLARHEPEQRVLIDTVNPERTQADELAAAYPGVIVHESAIPPEQVSRERMANRKCAVLRRAMDEYPGEPWYGLFDADFLVRRSLPDLWRRMERSAAAHFHTNGFWRGRFHLQLATPSGIILVRPDGRRLIESWWKWQQHDKPIGGIQPGAWFWDQVTLFSARRETQLSYDVLPMHIFASSTLDSGAAIWSANVDAAEKDRYFHLFEQELSKPPD
jgi:hypothetical protein